MRDPADFILALDGTEEFDDAPRISQGPALLAAASWSQTDPLGRKMQDPEPWLPGCSFVAGKLGPEDMQAW